MGFDITSLAQRINERNEKEGRTYFHLNDHKEKAKKIKIGNPEKSLNIEEKLKTSKY